MQIKRQDLFLFFILLVFESQAQGLKINRYNFIQRKNHDDGVSENAFHFYVGDNPDSPVAGLGYNDASISIYETCKTLLNWCPLPGLCYWQNGQPGNSPFSIM